MNNEICEFRKKIDCVDQEIVSLLKKRFELVRQLVEKKRMKGIAMEDLRRENDIIEKLRNGNNLDPQFIEEIYKLIFKYGKKKYSNF